LNSLLHPASTQACWNLTAAFFLTRENIPLMFVAGLSLVIGLLMPLIFRAASNQTAIHTAKDRIKAHLLAVRLYQDQLLVVLRSQFLVLAGTAHHLRLVLKPALFLAVPLTFLITTCDRYLGFEPLRVNAPFLVTVRTDTPDRTGDVLLKLPPGLAMTAPPVHIPDDREVVWRLAAEKEGAYDVKAGVEGKEYGKRVVVSSRLIRLSPVRLKGHLFERFFSSAEPELPEGAPIASIRVAYPERTIRFARIEWNWIWLFLALSLATGFLAKSILGIEI
jgi:hypothetical protein